MRVEPVDWEALARFVHGECTPAEAAEIRAWLDAEPARAKLIEDLEAHLSRHAPGDAPPVDVEGALATVHARLRAEPPGDLETAKLRRRPTPAWLAVAALVLVVLGAGALWRIILGRDGSTPDAPFTYATAVGQTDSLQLADGTLVVLGPGSTLTAEADYGRERRLVTLSGEAYFEVADLDPTFAVRAGGSLIEDLGTAFSVHSDPAANVRVAVTSGSVALRPSDLPGDAEVVLREGDRAALREGDLTVERGAVGEADLAWMRGTLNFEEATLAEVAFDMARWFGTEIRVADPALAGRRITASFAGETRNQALEVIRLALGAELQMRADTAIFSLAPAAP